MMQLKNVNDVLLINSYGGSILAAVMDLGLPIRGSCETSGYGLEVQRFNAPKVRFFENTADWPKEDLSKTLVIGHPPCSAFSTLNTPMRKKNAATPTASIDSKAFQCTKDLLEYAMSNGAEQVMVESVPRGMTEGAVVHEHYANKYGYSLIRVVQAAKNFGLSQNRKRFWCVFSKGVGREFTVQIPMEEPKPLGDIITHEGEPFADHVRQIREYDAVMKERWPDELKREELWRGDHGYGKVLDVLTKYMLKVENELNPDFAKKVVHNRWSVSAASLLHPEGLAPVVLQCSLWLMHGKLLTLTDYCRIMGFPDWYRFPERIAKTTNALGYLSRGVCPPIVKWLIKEFSSTRKVVDNAPLFMVKDGETLNVIEERKKLEQPEKVKKTSTGKVRAPRADKTVINDGVNPLAPRAVTFEDCCAIEEEEEGTFVD